MCSGCEWVMTEGPGGVGQDTSKGVPGFDVEYARRVEAVYKAKGCYTEH